MGSKRFLMVGNSNGDGEMVHYDETSYFCKKAETLRVGEYMETKDLLVIRLPDAFDD